MSWDKFMEVENTEGWIWKGWVAMVIFLVLDMISACIPSSQILQIHQMLNFFEVGCKLFMNLFSSQHFSHFPPDPPPQGKFCKTFWLLNRIYKVTMCNIIVWNYLLCCYYIVEYLHHKYKKAHEMVFYI